MPSHLEEDQWAEIHNHDYQLWVEQNEKAKADFLAKRDMVRHTLDN